MPELEEALALARNLSPDWTLSSAEWMLMARELLAAQEEVARLREALMVVAERHLIPVTHFGEWAVAIPTRPLTMTGYPAAGTPEGALLGAQAEIEGRAGK